MPTFDIYESIKSKNVSLRSNLTITKDQIYEGTTGKAPVIGRRYFFEKSVLKEGAFDSENPENIILGRVILANLDVHVGQFKDD